MEINHNFTQTKVGESICYHIGLLARDRDAKEAPNKFTDEAKIIQSVASSIYNRSTANQCSGEFVLFQKKISPDVYAYMAKRIKIAA